MSFLKITDYLIPAFIVFVVIYGLVKKVDIYAGFVEGAKEGLKTSVRIAPYLVGMLFAISVFRSSGALDFIVKLLSPAFNLFKIPVETAPLILLKPFSGSASLAMLSDILQQYGPDSSIGLLSSTLMGTSETLFYTLAVYLGAVGISKSRYCVGVSLLAMFFGILASVAICNYLF